MGAAALESEHRYRKAFESAKADPNGWHPFPEALPYEEGAAEAGMLSMAAGVILVTFEGLKLVWRRLK